MATLCIESWVLYKVVKVSNLGRNPYFVVMLTCLHFSLIASIAFFQLQAQVIRSPESVAWDTYVCTNVTTDFLPALFLAFATTLNTSKWIYFNCRV